ncbi:hypothetical protein LCGC14_0409160 [marine sediment metagenome]|uniref:RHS repeat-associated core domain-containing protein n=1 Tax=marine sediment metagenome TaxID=412755 RepID=A0A0F9VGD8_9ZZZZ|nr:RHS repeat-associated core domain-containing protein [Phycisphaerae bacterium]
MAAIARTHNKAGNMDVMPIPADEANTYDLTYDAWNRLVEVKVGEVVVTQCRYDGMHRRIATLEFVSSDNWTRTDFYYDTAWRVVEECRAEDLATSVTAGANNDKEDVITNVYAQYVWGLRYIDALILRDRDSDGNQTLDETLYYCNDANMNVTALINASGTVVERYEYTPYGQVTILDPDFTLDSDGGDGLSDVDNRILYAGYRHDTETGLYHVRHRYHHPTLGTWITRDPSGYADGMSLYEYVMGNPVVYRDPRGLTAEDRKPNLTVVTAPHEINYMTDKKKRNTILSNGNVDHVKLNTKARTEIGSALGKFAHTKWARGDKQLLPKGKAGASGFVMGWTIKAAIEVENGKCYCDLSDTKWRFLAYIILLNEQKPHPLRHTTGASVPISGTKEHEMWHVTGVPGAQRDVFYDALGVHQQGVEYDEGDYATAGMLGFVPAAEIRAKAARKRFVTLVEEELKGKGPKYVKYCEDQAALIVKEELADKTGWIANAGSYHGTRRNNGVYPARTLTD